MQFFPLTEEDEERLELLGAGTALLSHWRLSEECAFGRRGLHGGLQLGSPERAATLAFIARCLNFLGLPDHKHFEVATLLDAFLANAPTHVCAGSMPTVSIALTKVCMKLGRASSPRRVSLERLVPCVRTLSSFLGQLGHRATPVTQESVASMERAVVRALHGRVSAPSVASWLQKYRVRFAALTAGHFADLEQAIWNEGLSLAVPLTFTRALSAQFPPRVAAMGLLGLSFESHGLLSTGSGPPSDIGQRMLLRLLLTVVDADFGQLEMACRQVDRAVRDPLFTTSLRGLSVCRIAEGDV